MKADYIQRIDLDIVRTIISREQDRQVEVRQRARGNGDTVGVDMAVGAIAALNMVQAKLSQRARKGNNHG